MTVLSAWPRMTTPAAVVLATVAGLSFTTMPTAAQSTNPTVPTMIPQAAAHTVYAKIRAIDPLTRAVTMDAADGSTVTVIAAPGLPLENLEVGDRVDVNYYRSVAFLVAKGTRTPGGGQGTNLPPEQAGLLARHEQAQLPGGISVPVTHIVGLVVGVDPGTQTVDVVNPSGGGVYSIRASNPSRAAMIATLKVGDVVTAVITPPIATSIEPETGLFSKLSNLLGR